MINDTPLFLSWRMKWSRFVLSTYSYYNYLKMGIHLRVENVLFLMEIILRATVKVTLETCSLISSNNNKLRSQ